MLQLYAHTTAAADVVRDLQRRAAAADSERLAAAAARRAQGEADRAKVVELVRENAS